MKPETRLRGVRECLRIVEIKAAMFVSEPSKVRRNDVDQALMDLTDSIDRMIFPKTTDLHDRQD